MKKHLLLLTLCFPILLMGQLTADDFESYQLGDFDSQWDASAWAGWFNNPSNTTISDEQAHAGMNSLKIETDDDVVALLGVIDQEYYEITFWQYVPSGNEGYINLQHNYTPTAGGWTADTYIAANGAGIFISNEGQTQFPAVYDAWVEYKFNLNFITAEGQFTYNGQLVSGFALDMTNQGMPGLNQINAINFYGGCATTGCTSLAYYDDVEITFIPAPPFNVRVFDPAPPAEYSIVPSGLEQPINLEANIWNIGASEITNATVTFNVKDGTGATVYTETANPIAVVPSGDQFTVAATGTHTLTESDNYTIDYEVSIAEADADLADNTVSVNVLYANDPNIYARDDSNFDNGIGINNGTGTFGQTFDFIDQASVQSISVFFGGGMVGDSIAGHIYSLDATSGMPDTIIASTMPFEVTQVGAVGMEIFANLEFSDVVELPAGDYLFAIEQKANNNILVATSPSIYTLNKTWATTDSVTWNNLEAFNFAVALGIRPIINMVGVDVDESASNYLNHLEISPNPSDGFVTIDLQLLENKDLDIQVFNMNGQIVNTIMDKNTIGGRYELRLEELPSGVYFVKFQIDEQVVSRKLVLF